VDKTRLTQVHRALQQPDSPARFLPQNSSVRKRQNSLKNVILRPYYAVYFLE
jgi:hypothetical protein